MPSFKIIISFLLTCILFLPQINAQEIPNLQNASDSTQLPKQRLKRLIKAAKGHTNNGDFPVALEYWAKAVKLNKSLKVYDIYTQFDLTPIVTNISEDSLELMIKKLDKEIITSNFLNLIAKGINLSFYSAYPIKLAKEALQMSRLSEDTLEQAKSHYNIGATHNYLGHNDKALPALLKAKELYHAIKDTVNLLSTMRFLQAVYKYLSEFEKANLEIKDGLDLALTINNEYQIIGFKKASIFYIMGRGELKKALLLTQELYNRAIDLKKVYLINSYRQEIGDLLYKMGRYKEAKLWIDKAINFSTKNKRQEWKLPHAFYVSAECFKNLGVYDSAVYNYQQSIEYSQNINDPENLYRSLSYLSLLYFTLQDTTAAMECQNQLDSFFEEAPSDDFSNSTYDWIIPEWEAILYEATGHIDSAILSRKKLIDIYLQKKFNVSQEYLKLGQLYFLSGKIEASTKQFQETIKYVEEKGNVGVLGQVLYHLARIFVTEKDYDKALNYALRSLEIAKEYGHGKTLTELYPLLSTIYSQKNNYAQAYSYQIKLDSLEKLHYGYVQRDNVAKYAAKYRFKENQLEKERLQLEKERQANLLRQREIWLIIALIMLVTIVILGILYNQKAKLVAQNKLRKQLTRDIHDDVGGILNNLKMNVEEVLEEIPEGTRIEERLAQTLNLSIYATDSLRNLIWKVEGEDSQLDKFGKELNAYTSYYFNINKIPFKLQVHGFSNSEKMPFNLYYHLFMIYKEVLQNILKHGNKKGIDIQWNYQQGIISLSAKNELSSLNNGYKNSNGTHRGLDNMKNRAALINGNLDFTQQENLFILELNLSK